MPWLSCIVSNVILATLLALTAWFVQRWPGRPAVARVLWVLVLVKLVTPPLVSVPLRDLLEKGDGRQLIANAAFEQLHPTPPCEGGEKLLSEPVPVFQHACATGACGCGQHARTQSIAGDTLAWFLLAAWSAGAAATGWTAWRRWTRFRRLMAYAVPAPPEWQALAARLSAELSLRRPPEILAVPGRLPPLVVAGWRRPRLLLPTDLLARLQGSQREALLLHELVHLQRLDHLVRMLELTVSVAYWWLPVVGWIGRQLRNCEEACCDAAVLARLPQARRDYARLLLDVLDFVAPLPRQSVPQATAMSAAYDLERRLRTILDATAGTRRTWPAGAFAAGAFFVALACAILPCGLHYDFAGGPAATSAEREPAAGETCPPGGVRERAPFNAMCCPS